MRAAQADDLDMLKYAYENGCPWDELVWRRAGDSTREWLRANGLEGAPRQRITMVGGNWYVEDL